MTLVGPPFTHCLLAFDHPPPKKWHKLQEQTSYNEFSSATRSFLARVCAAIGGATREDFSVQTPRILAHLRRLKSVEQHYKQQ